MKIYKITEASKYLGISINSLKTLANNGKLNSFKTGGAVLGKVSHGIPLYIGEVRGVGEGIYIFSLLRYRMRIVVIYGLGY